MSEKKKLFAKRLGLTMQGSPKEEVVTHRVNGEAFSVTSEKETATRELGMVDPESQANLANFS